MKSFENGMGPSKVRALTGAVCTYGKLVGRYQALSADSKERAVYANKILKLLDAISNAYGYKVEAEILKRDLEIIIEMRNLTS